MNKEYKLMEVSDNGIVWYKRNVIELFNSRRCRALIERSEQLEKFLDNEDNYKSRIWNYCREIKEPIYRPYKVLTEEIKQRLISDSFVKCKDAESSMYIGIGAVYDERVYIKGTYYTLKDMYERYTYIDGTPFGEEVEE